MKILKEKEKIGEMKDKDIVIDWDYITKGHGFRREIENLQISLGKLLRVVCISSLSAFLVFDFTLGNILIIEAIVVDRFIEVLFWGIIFIFIYTFYLLRDRSQYIDTLEIKDLDILRKKEENKKLPKEIEIEDFFDYDLLNILDDLVNSSDRDFLNQLMNRLIELPEVLNLINRLGATKKTFENINKKSYIEMNTSRDTWLTRILFESFVLSYKYNLHSVDEKSVFLSLCLVPFKDILLEYEIFPDELNGVLLWVQYKSKKRYYEKLWEEKASLKPQNTVNRSYTSVFAQTLERYKRDFTGEILSNDFVLSIAREEELSEMTRLLHQGDKGAILLIGEPGVGKTTLIKSLAYKMVVEDVPEELEDKRLVAFDFNKAYASAPSIERFRMILEKVFEEVHRAGNIILVFDNIEQVVDIRQEVSSEVVNLIVDAINQYNLRIVATVSRSGFLNNLKPRKSLVNLFDKIEINEPDDKVAIQILIDEAIKLEKRNNINISYDAIIKTVELSHKYAFDRVLPEKGIDLLEEAIVFAEDNQQNFVSDKDIAKLVSQKVGVDIGVISDEEKNKLINLEREMHKRVVGQNVPINNVANALRRARAGFNDSNKPIASFLFFGPTGVGKTEVAKTLADVYYGDVKLMIRLDMSEFQEDENLGRLIGYREGDDFYGGILTESVRERPFSLILLDELEKANPKVLDIFLQILDEGHVTDGIGREVNFSNTIIIATSNVGSNKISKMIEKGKSYKETYKKVLPLLRERYRVEFLNRFDKVIMFKPLMKSEIEQIADIAMKNLTNRLYEKGIVVDYKSDLLSQLAQKGYNPVYGARELKRVIQEEIEDKIAMMIVKNDIKPGKKLIIHDFNNFEVVD